MQRKLQIFISSTYDDMHEERQAVVEEILRCGHIPAGMELFGSDNRSQFEIIKNWIKNCDVFLLILGGRYGSVSNDRRINKSYIHREYEYAKSIGKKPYALIMSEEFILEKAKNHIYSHEDPEYLKSDYKSFKKSISDRKLCEFFSSVDQLKEQVNAVLRKCEEEHEKKNTLTGWIRAEDLLSNIGLAKYILENNANDIDVEYNPFIYSKFKEDFQNKKFLEEYYIQNLQRLQESIEHNTFIESYDRDITISLIDTKGIVQINTTTKIKYFHIGDNDYFSFNPRFNHFAEADSLATLQLLIKIDGKWSSLSSGIEKEIVDHGENERWRYQTKHKLNLPMLKTFDDIEIIHEYRFLASQENVFQMNQLRYPCKSYSVKIIPVGLDSDVFPVISSCSQYNVYSSSLFSPEQYKGTTSYSINLPKWTLPGSGYFLTLQKNNNIGFSPS